MMTPRDASRSLNVQVLQSTSDHVGWSLIVEPYILRGGTMRTVHLALAILGTVVPYVFLISHFQTEGLGLGTFAQAPYV